MATGSCLGGRDGGTKKATPLPVSGMPGPGTVEPGTTGASMESVYNAGTLTFVVGYTTLHHVSGAAAGVLTTVSPLSCHLSKYTPPPSAVPRATGNVTPMSLLLHSTSVTGWSALGPLYGVPPGAGVTAPLKTTKFGKAIVVAVGTALGTIAVNPSGTLSGMHPS